LQCPRWRWPTPRSRACFSFSAELGYETNDQSGGGNPAASIDLAIAGIGWRLFGRAFVAAIFRKGRGWSRPRRTLEKETTMPLRVELKPFERIVIGETVIINSGTRTSFLIDGEAPILREKDTVTAETANTPVKRLYFCVQMMYLKNDVPKYRASYLGFVKDLRETIPGSRDLIDAVNNNISSGALYKALKEIRKLMKREEELLTVNA
jgi:flagellar biosynthesis repressor protein FlbT